MAFVITSPCQNEKAAEYVEVCPVDCISEGDDQFYINAEVCIDCGACEAICPVKAIYLEEEVPDNEFKSIQMNRDFFK